MRRAAGLVISASLLASLQACRDYDRFTHVDADLSTADAAVLDATVGDGFEAPDGATPDSAACAPLDTEFAIRSEHQTMLAPDAVGSPRYILHGQFRGTGVDVLAVTPGDTTGTAKVTLLEPRPDGTFQVVNTSTLARGATAAAVMPQSTGDLLVTAYDCDRQDGCGLAALRWNGAAFVEIGAMARTSRPTALQVADINHDASPDLVVTSITNTAATPPYSPGSILIFSTSPATPFNWSSSEMGSSIAIPSALAVADFDGDGTTDILVLGTRTDGTPNALELLKGSGNSMVMLTGPAVVSANPLPLNDVMSFITADLDGDGRSEVILGGRNEMPRAITVLSWANNPMGPFFTAQTIPTSGLVFGLAAVDWDQNGKKDLFAWIQPSAALTDVVPTLFQADGMLGYAEHPMPAWKRSSQVVPRIASPDVLDFIPGCGTQLVFTDGSATVSTFTR